MTQSRIRSGGIIPLIFVSVILACGSLLAAEPDGGPGNRAPAGQVCPHGSYVIGFDADANILCSGTCGNGVLNTGETCDDGNLESGDGCSATCTAETLAAEGKAAAVAVATAPAVTASPASSAVLAIDEVKPWSVVYGTREVSVTISGTGFNKESVVVFQGKTYQPSVDESGTRLEATIATRNLSIGSYAITVSNGTGMETTLKKALVVY